VLFSGFEKEGNVDMDLDRLSVQEGQSEGMDIWDVLVYNAAVDCAGWCGKACWLSEIQLLEGIRGVIPKCPQV